jgi:gas vesicle protein
MKEFRRRGGALRTLIAFTFGAAAGSILALLYAPASGRVTRRRLALKAQNLRRNAVRQIGQTRRALVLKAGAVREAATQWVAEHVPGNGRHPLRRRGERRLVSH